MKPIERVPSFAPTRREEDNGDGSWTVFIRPPAMFDLPEQSLRLTIDQYQRYLLWRKGNILIQEALPDLSPIEREILLTGLSNEDFHKFAGDENDDDNMGTI